MALQQYVAAAFMAAGAVFSLLAAVGVLRLPDLYTRMHAASKAGVVGAGLVLLAMAIESGDGSVIIRAVLGVLFLLLTTPVSAHLLAKAAYRAGYKPIIANNVNDLEKEMSE
ncbi:monovalent cation/H(+) antiporter subunit G [Devosia sp.]|uniref:monovalent cation/H(+) antiporter subunit G n=1 Tax=Devosia sp. TaxID=1871048 RepID=UPI002F092274